MVHTPTAPKTGLVQPTNFVDYDFCVNPYVGCEFGCCYCYVPFTVRLKGYDWGDFVKLRKHIMTLLPRHLEKAHNAKVVLGTMTDPYQPLEQTHRYTREVLKAMAKMKNPVTRLGIFTKSPILLDDIKLIKTFNDPRVHVTISPYSDHFVKKTAKVATTNEERFKMIEELKKHKITVFVNIAPAMPILTDGQEDKILKRLAKLKVDQFYVDPVQLYKPAKEALESYIKGEPEWPKVKKVIDDKAAFKVWKAQLQKDFAAAWTKHDNKTTVPVWCDHVNRKYDHLITGKKLGWF
jgi:DNA repair photolyase